MTVYNILDFNAAGDGIQNDAPAIQNAIDACHEAGGGRVLLPSGRVYYSGSIELKSNIDFHVEIGACLVASREIKDYSTPGPNKGESSISSYNGRPCHYFIHAKAGENIKISGNGSINGNSQAFSGIATKYHIAGKTNPRPVMIFLEACNHITVTDITLKNSHFWTLHPAGCNDVSISNIRILNDLKMANSDGIDPDHCTNVRITNCHIEAADDCIVLKNTKDMEEYGPTENIIITNCTLISTSSAVKIGTESVSDFRNIIVDSCIISKSNRGISIQIRDGGMVENVRYSNIIIETRRFHECWWGKAEPIYVTSFNRNDSTKSGKIKNVSFRNITCSSENGIVLSGREGNCLEEILLENIRVEIVKWTKWPRGIYDMRPCEGEGIVERDNAGIFCTYVNDVTLRHVKVIWGQDEMPEYYGAALEAENVDGLKMEDFQGKGARKGVKDIIIH